MSETSKKHKKQAPKRLRFAIVTVSTSRYQESKAGKLTTDESGDLIVEAVRKNGHIVHSRGLISDDKAMIKTTIRGLLGEPAVDAIIFTGGTGVNPADVTIETVQPFIEKELPGFGEIFRRISYDQIGSAAVMTRAMAGVAKGKAIFCLPGSPQAVKLCLEMLILPETAHIVLHARGRQENKVLYDSCGRPALNLRISLTQRCNLKCVYCHREGQIPGSAMPEMTADEVVRIGRVAISLGMSFIKLTGGEPLLRSDIVDIIHGLAVTPGLRDLAMTTNGTHLSKLAQPLKQAGLKRVNINLPSLDPHTYSMVNGGDLNDVLNGVRQAVKAGLFPVKLNMLVLQGINTDDIPKMIEFARQSNVILQLMELEPVNIKDDFYLEHFFSLESFETELKKQAKEVETRGRMQNRHVYTLPDVKVEVVHPIENTDFCAHCTRLRVTSDGKLKPCLMVNDNLVDVLTPLRNGATDKDLEQLFFKAVKRREPYYKPAR